MIDWYDSFKLILKSMDEKKGRVFLTVSGIIIGIFVFTFFIFVSQGLSNTITEQFSSIGANAIVVQPANTLGDPTTSTGGLTDTDIAKIKQVVKNYDFVAGQVLNNGLFEYGNEKQYIYSVAYPEEYIDDYTESLGIEIEKGRGLRVGDRGVVVLGYKTATETFEREIKVGSSLKIEGRSLRVIGIVKERGDLFLDSSIVMSMDDMLDISGKEGYDVIRVNMLPDADLNRAKEAIDQKLNPNNDEEYVDIQTSQDIIDQFNQILGVLTAIISFISSIALIVGFINVMNTMYSSVLERINQISVMKALGATNEDIRNLYLVESGILGLTGGLIGFLMAYGLAEIISFGLKFAGYNVPIYFGWLFMLEVVAVTTIFAMIFGTYPALKAAKTNPADNLRDE